MICCDHCEEWFHGMCVGITMAQGRQMEKNGQEYVCPKCLGESSDKGIALKGTAMGILPSLGQFCAKIIA